MIPAHCHSRLGPRRPAKEHGRPRHRHRHAEALKARRPVAPDCPFGDHRQDRREQQQRPQSPDSHAAQQMVVQTQGHAGEHAQPAKPQPRRRLVDAGFRQREPADCRQDEEARRTRSETPSPPPGWNHVSFCTSMTMAAPPSIIAATSQSARASRWRPNTVPISRTNTRSSRLSSDRCVAVVLLRAANIR